MSKLFVLLVLGLSSLVSLARAAPSSEPNSSYGFPPGASALVYCLTSKRVPISQVSQPNFTQLAKPFNLRLVYVPAAIALPTTSQHVADAVICASASNIKVQAKSGGHSYASYSSGGQNGTLVVDLEPMQMISVDNATGIAKVGAGVRLGNLALGIFKQGNRALPHGTCAGVGIGGHFTHGGYGYDSRIWGLALDTIVGLDVVLANGSYIHASATSYPDIYFALRGAADSFGIVTTFHLQTLPAPPTVISLAVEIPAVLGNVQTAVDSFLHIQNFAQNASVVDRRLSFGMYMNGYAFVINGLFFGSFAEFNSTILSELLRGLPAPLANNCRELDWIAALTVLAGAPLETPLTGYNAHDTFYAKSIVTQESAPLTRAAMESFFSYVTNQGRNAPSPWFSIINLYGGPDSQINARPLGSAAYSHRSALWVFQNYGNTANGLPPFSHDTIDFLNGMNNAVISAQPDGAFDGYLNYVDPELTPQQAHTQYFGEPLYSRLLSLKQQVDPKQTFWNPQAIGVN